MIPKLNIVGSIPITLRIERELAAVAKLGYSLALHPTDGSVAVGGLNGEIRRMIVRQEKR